MSAVPIIPDEIEDNLEFSKLEWRAIPSESAEMWGGHGCGLVLRAETGNGTVTIVENNNGEGRWACLDAHDDSIIHEADSFQELIENDEVAKAAGFVDD